MGMPALLLFTAQMAVSIRKLLQLHHIYLLWSLRAGSDLANIIGIIAVGMPASQLFTRKVAVSLRKSCFRCTIFTHF